MRYQVFRGAYIDYLIMSYDKVLHVWTVQNENYFKRVQVFMGILQAGLFIAILRIISASSVSWFESLLSLSLAVLGCASAWLWRCLNNKQMQYFEFSRRVLRNIESKLLSVGVPLSYFTVESLVFGPKQKNLEARDMPGTLVESMKSVKSNDKKPWLARFKWSKEQYPECNQAPQKVHRVSRVSGGALKLERRLATWAFGLWIAMLFIILIQLLMIFMGQTGTVTVQRTGP